MKRFFAAAALFLMSLCLDGNISAGNFGILGGANFSTTNIKQINAETMTQWHAGIAYKFDLPLGFDIQPALLYNVKGADFKVNNLDLSVGYLELMASVQWGVDLILFRPFVDISPFVGYAVDGQGSLKDIWKKDGNRLEWGAGFGGGLDIWRFQIAARYNWNLGRILNVSDSVQTLKDAKFSGVTLTLTCFF